MLDALDVSASALAAQRMRTEVITNNLANAHTTRDAMGRIEAPARNVLAASSAGDALRTNLTFLRRFTKFDPVNAVALRRRIAGRVIEAEKYIVHG